MVAIRMKYIRCGKSSCRCNRGKKHGPYYYLREYIPGTGSRDRYLGKKIPEGCYYDERVDLIRIIGKEFDLPLLRKKLNDKRELKTANTLAD